MQDAPCLPRHPSHPASRDPGGIGRGAPPSRHKLDIGMSTKVSNKHHISYIHILSKRYNKFLRLKHGYTFIM